MANPEDDALIERIRNKLDQANAPFGRDCHGKPWRLEIEQLLYGMARIIVTDGWSVEQWWEYETEKEAHAAVDVWMALGFQGEPEGWRRASPEDKDAFNNLKIRYRPGLREEQRAETDLRLYMLGEQEKRMILGMQKSMPIVKYEPTKDTIPWPSGNQSKR